MALKNKNIAKGQILDISFLEIKSFQEQNIGLQ